MNEPRRTSRYVSAAAIAVVAAAAAWLATRSLQQDFAAYWVAGTARRAGLSPYVNHVGGPHAPDLWDGVAVFAHSRFLYPPLAAEAFRLLARLPYFAAKLSFSAASVAAWIAASVTAARQAQSRDATALFVVGALAYPLYLHLERGQLDLLLLPLLLAAFSAERTTRAGLALAAAAAFKPTLLALVPVLAAMGRRRVAGFAAAGAAVVVAATFAVSGPALAWEYAREVLPRAALYGEGGDASMLLPSSRLEGRDSELEDGAAHVDGRVYRQEVLTGPASASLPRLLAPDGPTAVAARAPALLLLGALLAAARAVRRRGAASQALVLWAAAVACVIASPAGWIMGFVWGLPLVAWLGALRDGAETPASWWALALAGVVCACPPPASAWAPLAGLALVAAAVWLALAQPREGAA
jgi:hypothetical protein